MKKIIILTFLIAITTGFSVYYYVSTLNIKTTHSIKTTSPYEYKNTKLGIIFNFKDIDLYERNSGDVVNVSDFNDPHFYSNKECSENYNENCFAMEVQSVILPNQKKKDVISSLGKAKKMDVNNPMFDFYKQADGSESGGWAVSYFASAKNEDLYFNILTNSTSTVLVESIILPSFIKI